MTRLPDLRPPTLYERAIFKVTGRWPNSYVEARLAHHDAAAAVLTEMTLNELNYHAANALAKAKAAKQ